MNPQQHPKNRSAAARSRRRGPAGSRRGLILPLLLGALVLGGALAGWWWLSRERKEKPDAHVVLHKVARDDFALTVTERGEVESAGVTDVVSEVKSKNQPGVAILKIIPEGTQVKKGDFLVELDSSALREERNTEQIAVNTAEALVVQSRNVFETAQIAKEEYLDGTYIQDRQTIEGEVFVAEENLNRAKEYYEYSKRLAAKGYINQLQLEADKFAVDKSLKELGAARTKLKVIDDYTKVKMLKQLESDIITAKAKWESDKKSYEIELAKLQEIDDQIAKCTINAPKDGVVTYAHDRENWGGDNFIVKEGAVIRERQAIIRLPDPSKMRVALNVNESLIRYIHAGMPATIAPVGAGDHVLQGSVASINQYAEPSGWRKANVKEYKALVSIDEAADNLRSGMTASVTIHSTDIPNVIQAPVQAVYAHGKDYFAFVYNQGRWEARPVRVEPTNDKFFVIEEGLNEGDMISMTPRLELDKVKLPALAPEGRAAPASRMTKADDKPTAVAAKTGNAQASDAKTTSSPTGG
jgi:RND family efflux transporter MFP subunit